MMTIVIDLVFLQLNDTGIARFWTSVLEQWAASEFANLLVLLVRDNFVRTPRFANLKYVKVPPLDYQQDATIDRQMLQQVCNGLDASLFISTYYTCPTSTPSCFMCYDMIPEMLQHDLSTPMWQAKAAAIDHATSYIAISHSTAKDLSSLCDVPLDRVAVVYPGIDKSVFYKRPQIDNAKPYFMLVGAGFGYKNGELLLNAMAALDTPSQYQIVCTGSKAERFVTVAALSHPQVDCVAVNLSDEELAIKYSGAVALVYPSRYEGFGLPIVEAMSCGCPVVTCRSSSLPEAAGEAAWYVDEDNPSELASVLHVVLANGQQVKDKVQLGYLQADKFSWRRAATELAKGLGMTQ